jgi:hypothetical protein
LNTKITLSIAAIILVAATLVGVTAAQFATNQTTSADNSQALPPCVSTNGGVVPPYCINATTGEPYCNINGTYTGYCQGGQAWFGYGAQAQNQNQYQYRYGCNGGMMGRVGWGGCW